MGRFVPTVRALSQRQTKLYGMVGCTCDCGWADSDSHSTLCTVFVKPGDAAQQCYKENMTASSTFLFVKGGPASFVSLTILRSRSSRGHQAFPRLLYHSASSLSVVLPDCSKHQTKAFGSAFRTLTMSTVEPSIFSVPHPDEGAPKVELRYWVSPSIRPCLAFHLP
jgi:hypothetical protein